MLRAPAAPLPVSSYSSQPPAAADLTRLLISYTNELRTSEAAGPGTADCSVEWLGRAKRIQGRKPAAPCSLSCWFSLFSLRLLPHFPSISPRCFFLSPLFLSISPSFSHVPPQSPSFFPYCPSFSLHVPHFPYFSLLLHAPLFDISLFFPLPSLISPQCLPFFLQFHFPLLYFIFPLALSSPLIIINLPHYFSVSLILPPYPSFSFSVPLFP